MLTALPASSLAQAQNEASLFPHPQILYAHCDSLLAQRFCRAANWPPSGLNAIELDFLSIESLWWQVLRGETAPLSAQDSLAQIYQSYQLAYQRDSLLPQLYLLLVSATYEARTAALRGEAITGLKKYREAAGHLKDLRAYRSLYPEAELMVSLFDCLMHQLSRNWKYFGIAWLFPKAGPNQKAREALIELRTSSWSFVRYAAHYFPAKMEANLNGDPGLARNLFAELHRSWPQNPVLFWECKPHVKAWRNYLNNLPCLSEPARRHFQQLEQKLP